MAPNETSIFQALNIMTRIRKGWIEIMMDTIVVEKGEEVPHKLLTRLDIQRQYKNELVFMFEDDLYIPARYTIKDVNHPLCEAGMVVEALSAQVHYPLESNVRRIVQESFWDVLALAAALLGDQFVMNHMNKDYVRSVTSYYAQLENERSRLSELAEIESTRKVEVVEMEHEITKLKASIAAYDQVYKNMKAKFEDQDFSFNGLQMNVTPYEEQMLITSNKKIIPVLVELKIGKAPETSERVPFSLAVVLDRSGSMSGAKLANCKLAIANIISKMTSDDILHFIVYDDVVDVIFVDGDLARISELRTGVDDVKARNMTNISAALEKTIDVFRESSSTSHRRAFLFSDGQANSGLKLPSELGKLAQRMQEEEQIITSTFGIGADFNYEIMDGIARAGHGSYFFIDESEHIPKLVDKGLRGLTSLLATDAFLRIKSVAKGVKVSKVYGHEVVDEIPVGDLRFGDLKQILVELDIDSGEFLVGSQDLLTFELVFKSQEHGKGMQKNFSLAFTHDPTSVANQTVNSQVEVTKAIKDSADLDTLALHAFRDGKIDHAIDYKRSKILALERVSLFDRYGFTKVLLQKTRISLLDFLQQSLRTKVAQYNDAVFQINRKYNKSIQTYYSAHGIEGAAKSNELLHKQLAYEAMQDEDDDMGYSLFD